MRSWAGPLPRTARRAALHCPPRIRRLAGRRRPARRRRGTRRFAGRRRPGRQRTRKRGTLPGLDGRRTGPWSPCPPWRASPQPSWPGNSVARYVAPCAAALVSDETEPGFVAQSTAACAGAIRRRRGRDPGPRRQSRVLGPGGSWQRRLATPCCPISCRTGRSALRCHSRGVKTGWRSAARPLLDRRSRCRACRRR